MSDTVIDTVASALALEIFRDNLALREKNERLHEFLRHLEDCIRRDIAGDERFASYLGYVQSMMPPRPRE